MGYEPDFGFVFSHMARAILDHLPKDASSWTPELLAFLADPRKVHIDNLAQIQPQTYNLHSMSARRLFILVAAALLPRAEGTPVVVVVKPDHVIMGSNHVDSQGMQVCKLMATPSVVMLKSSSLARARSRRTGEFFDPAPRLWRSLLGENSFEQLESRIKSTLEWAAGEMVRIAIESEPKEYFARPDRQADFLNSISANIVLAVSRFSGPEVEFIQVTYKGWPSPKATFTKTSFAPRYGDVVVWNTNSLPVVTYTLPQASSLEQDHHVELLTMKKMADNLGKGVNRSFDPPFDIIDVSASGIRRLEGSSETCDADRSRATTAKTSILR
jgi:hypothetical protein